MLMDIETFCNHGCMDRNIDDFLMNSMDVIMLHDTGGMLVGDDRRAYMLSYSAFIPEISLSFNMLYRFATIYPNIASRINGFIMNTGDGYDVSADNADTYFHGISSCGGSHDVARLRRYKTIADFIYIIMLFPIIDMGEKLHGGYDDDMVMKSIIGYTGLRKRAPEKSNCFHACSQADVGTMASYIDRMDVSSGTMDDVSALLREYREKGLYGYHVDALLMNTSYRASSWLFMNLLSSFPNGMSYDDYQVWYASHPSDYDIKGYPCASMHTYAMVRRRYHAIVGMVSKYPDDIMLRMSDYEWFANIVPTPFSWFTFTAMMKYNRFDSHEHMVVIDAGAAMSAMGSCNGEMAYALQCSSRLLYDYHGSYHDMDVDALHMFVDDVNQGLPYEHALETMRINELS